MPFDQLPAIQDSETIDQLRAARALIEAGWCRHARVRDQHSWMFGWRSQYCVLGALSQALYGHPYDTFDDGDFIGPVKAVCSAIKRCGFACRAIDYWNDRPERSKQDVLDMLDDAIGIARQYNL